MSELVVSKKKAVNEIDWENLEIDGTKMCSILNGPDCESCGG